MDNRVIGIYGAGIVGGATGKLFETMASGKIEVVYYDKYKKIGSKEEVVQKCDIIFLCLPTPMKITGEVSLDYLYSALEEINTLAVTPKTLVIRSTAVSGSTETFAKKYPAHDFAFCPEFLTESNSVEDMLKAERVVIGTPDEFVFDKLKGLFQCAYGPKVDYIQLDWKEAETLKYLSNVMLASQVMVANELYFICRKLGVEYDKLRELLKYDGRIGTHNKVPGSDGDFGFGGKCFPKDLSAFVYLARKSGYEPTVLDAILKMNDRVRIKKDWLEIEGATYAKGYETNG